MLQQFADQPGLGDDGLPMSDAIAASGGALAGPAESLPDSGDGDTTVSRCLDQEALPVDDSEEAHSRRVPKGADAPKPLGPPGKCKGAAKRERILRAATELFATRAFHRVLMDDVAQGAEVGKGTLYRYFKTKEDLFVAALAHAVDVTTERLRARLEKLDDPVKQLRFACVQALRFFRENDHLFHVLHHRKALGSEEARAELAEKRRGLRHFAENIIVEGNEAGVFDVEDAGFASTILWGMIRTALRTAPDEAPLDELAGKITGLFINGIAKR